MQESRKYLDNINLIITYLLECDLNIYKLYCILALSKEDSNDLCRTIRFVNREKDRRVIDDFDRMVNKINNESTNTSNLKPNAHIYFADYLEYDANFDMLIKLINYNIMELFYNIINKNIVYSRFYCQRKLVSTIERFYEIDIDDSEYNKIYLKRESTYGIQTHPDNYCEIVNNHNQSSASISVLKDEQLAIANDSSKNSIAGDFEFIKDDIPPYEAEYY